MGWVPCALSKRGEGLIASGVGPREPHAEPRVYKRLRPLRRASPRVEKQQRVGWVPCALSKRGEGLIASGVGPPRAAPRAESLRSRRGSYSERGWGPAS